MVNCVEVAFASRRYRDLLRLREKYLRAPLGLKLTSQDTCDDQQQWHFASLADGKIIAGVIIAPGSQQSAQLRQMVVDKQWQGKGVGETLLRFAHDQSAQRGVQTITLNARDSAVGFYTRFGYRRCGASHTLFGIVHWPMAVELLV